MTAPETHPIADDPGALSRQGLAALRAGREDGALPALIAGTARFPADARVWQVRALLHRAAEETGEAVAAFARAASLAPGDARIALGRAYAALEAGLPAVALFERAERLGSADPALRLGLASARLADVGIDAAIAGLARDVAGAPGWLEGQSVLARLRWSRGEADRFTASLDAALAAAPGDLALWGQLLALLMQADRYDDTLAAIARGRASAGAHPVFDLAEAASLSEAGDVAGAEQAFVRLPPLADAGSAVYLVRHRLRAGRPEDAIAAAAPFAGSPFAHLFHPYLAIAWRLTDPARWRWLEGDEAFVGSFDLAGRLPPLDSLAGLLRRLHFGNAHPLEQSLRGGTQTDGALLSRVEPELAALRAAIVAAVETYVARLPAPDPAHPLLGPRRDRPVRFAGSWSVRLGEAGRHVNHVHPKGWISSALYVALPAPAGRGEPPAGWLALGEPDERLGLDLPPVRLVEPRPGRLVLFPSTMWHGTRPYAGGERLTVAFDVAPPRG